MEAKRADRLSALNDSKILGGNNKWLDQCMLQ
ncbi:hypothetical protein C820_000558 [Clostridium sp. MD294]|nr:hypothetical protein C820_000558 [Clostridium sp. MD294]